MANFNYPTLDPANENELTEAAKMYAFRVSNGAINDFSQAGALDTLLRTQAYCGAELLSYVNLLPLSIALQILEFAGVTPNVGAKATAIVRFTLIVPSGGLFTIPSGFEVQSNSQGESLQYKTVQTLEIGTGQTFGDVAIIANDIGAKYNLALGKIDSFITPLSGLKSVVNTEALKGGADAELEDLLIERSKQALRRRAPISVIDYEEFAVESMGGGIAKCIPALSLDRNNNEPGAAHVFILSADGLPANVALVQKVKSELGALVHIGTKLYVSPMATLEVDGYIIAQLQEDYDPLTVAENLWLAFTTFFSYQRYLPGEAVIISELQSEMRLTDGLKYIETVSVNNSYINIPMTNAYTQPIATSLTVELVTSTNAIYKRVLGIIPMDSLP